jgi:hypothetical protein
VLDTVRFDNKVYVEQYNDRCHYGIKECVYINIDTTDRMGKKTKQLLSKQPPPNQPLPKQHDPDTEHVEAIVPSTIPKPRLDHSKYWCGHCNFSARTPSSYRNHLYSMRHYRNYQATSNPHAKEQPQLSDMIEAELDMGVIFPSTDPANAGCSADLANAGCSADLANAGCSADLANAGCSTDLANAGCSADLANAGCSADPQPSIPSNEIIHLLGSDTESDNECASDTDLNTEVASENVSNTESEYDTGSETETETGSETETETETNTETNEYDDEFDRDLPWFGTGLFAHHHRSHRSIGGWRYLNSSDGSTPPTPSRPDFVGQSNQTSSGVARKSISTQPQEFGNMSIFIASAFIGGMLLERFMAQYVHDICAC